MKVAVYDRHWSTGGGGEKFAAGIAAALAPDHDVALIAHEPVDTAWLGERLALDLAGVTVDVRADTAGSVPRASAAYDLFVNASYRSGDANRARHGLYVAHFPGPAPGRVERTQAGVAGRAAGVLDGAVRVTFGDGFYLPERARLRTIHWTAGDATITLSAAPGRAGGTVPVVVVLARLVPREVGPVVVAAEADGAVLGTATVTAPTSRLDRSRTVALAFDVAVPAGGSRTVTLRSPAWVASEHGVGSDTRHLGVPVVGVYAGGGWRRSLVRAVPTLVADRNRLDFLATYDKVLANSAYTQAWIRRLWHHDSDILHPPVTLMEPGEKGPLILAVGRFFLPGTGHNKKQREMVEAFRRLCARGCDGWELHLVGGCSPAHAPYLEEVRRAAADLPVTLHPDATGAELRDLYARASIFWHAAGLGEHTERHPDRYEHFGITTVEAMSAGAVPVVIDAAGQVEIVEQGVSGYRFATLDGLVDRTAQLIADPAWRATLGAAARARAERFGWDVFTERLRAELAGLER